MIDLKKKFNTNNNDNVNTNTNPNNNFDSTFFSIDNYSKEATTASVFSKDGLFSFAGRRGRQKYLMVALAVSFLDGVVMELFKRYDMVVFIIGVLILLVQSTNIAKRMHDIEIPGKYALVLFGLLIFSNLTSKTLYGFFLVVQFIFSLILLFKKGTNGSNKYGPDPLK